MEIKSYAKVNLALDILGKDNSTGYHFIQTVITEVPSLFDTIQIEENNNDKIVISCSNNSLPSDIENTCYKAIKLLKEEYGINKGATVYIDKNIPISAGLGGGSSNAAAVINALNNIWQINRPKAELEKIAAKIGMDSVFFLHGGTCVCSHFGEVIFQLPSINGLEIKIIDTGVKIQSADAYNQIDTNKIGKNKLLTDNLISLIKSENLQGVEKYIHNDFEYTINPKYSEIESSIIKLKSQGAKSANLCGSGGCVFGVFY